MATCSYCGWHQGRHDTGCPVSPAHDEVKMRKWKCGYEDGSSGKDYWSSDPSYRIGMGRGIVALETRENEVDPRLYN
ncbi:MAG TPA: hypothetical protein VGE35_04340 [Candidatus Paceibacterota bacterium]